MNFHSAQPNCAADCGQVREQEERIRELTQALRQADEERIRWAQSEKLAAIGLLARALAHGINNPLMVVLGRLDLLLEEARPEEDQRYLAAIRAEAQRIADATQTLRCFSHMPAREDWQPLHVHDLLDEAIRSLQPELAQRQIQTVREWQAGTDLVQGQAIPLRQALSGVLRHVSQAGPRCDLLLVRTVSHQRWIEVGVRGGRPNAAETEGQRLFDPLFTDPADEVGIDLAMAGASAIVSAHGGYITVPNTPGQALKFHVHLPVLAALTPASEPDPPPAEIGPTQEESP
jgi:C4-dicarboxylate-specific signal transduction histidine kinase